MYYNNGNSTIEGNRRTNRPSIYSDTFDARKDFADPTKV